jgi:hypothetical protein
LVATSSLPNFESLFLSKTHVIYKASGNNLALQSRKNKHFLKLIVETLRTKRQRKNLVKSGQWIDCPYEQIDKIYELPELSEEQKQKDYISWPLPKMTKEMKDKFLTDMKVYGKRSVFTIHTPSFWSEINLLSQY